jgi:hypothetical protein
VKRHFDLSQVIVLIQYLGFSISNFYLIAIRPARYLGRRRRLRPERGNKSQQEGRGMTVGSGRRSELMSPLPHVDQENT